MSRPNELQTILREVGSDKVWRPIYDSNHKLLTTGVETNVEGLHSDLSRIDFKDKTVVDLGCNFGYFTFWARKQDARHVLGIDIDQRIIRGCNLLMKMYNYDGIDFLSEDITKINGLGRFDIAMMIDFIGKNWIRTGEMIPFLKITEHLARKEMLISVRPVYSVKKHFQNDFKGLLDIYPSRFIRNNRFHTFEFIEAYFEDRWNATVTSPEIDPDESHKKILHFHRK
jgi:ribosomal protein L11 methyltransferase